MPNKRFLNNMIMLNNAYVTDLNMSKQKCNQCNISIVNLLCRNSLLRVSVGAGARRL